MKILFLLLLLASHLPLAVRALRNRSIYLIGLSFVLYFDLEIAFEAFGGKYSNPPFKSFFGADDLTLCFAALALILGPWLLAAGYYLYSLSRPMPNHTRFRLLHPRWFYCLAMLICSATATLSVYLASGVSTIWAARAMTGELMGPWIIILYAPLGVLGFYIQQRESHRPFGRVFTLIISLLASLSAMCMGQRTMVLLPWLMLCLFWGRPSFRRIAVSSTVLLLGAAFVLPAFKVQSAESTFTDTVTSVFSGDIARGPVLTKSIEDSELFGTHLFPYPGAGYVYSLLLYTPRTVAPFKGESTAKFFTAHTNNQDTEGTDWVYGISAIDELILNFGLLFLPVGLFCYGIAFAFIDHIAESVPAFKVAGSLAALWFMGYNLPALMQTFGSIALFGGLCHWCFTKRQRVIPARLIVLRYTAPQPQPE